MDNRLSQNFNALSLLLFATPTTIMLVFISIYQMIDGIFVANVVGENALSALNIVYPIPSIVIAISIMLSTGSSAIIAKNMGEGKEREAKENFSLILCIGLLFSVVWTLLGLIFIKPLIYLLGATESMYQYCYDYLLILILSSPFCVFQLLFQNLFVTAGKPTMGLITTAMGGIANIILDYLFIAVWHMGVRGAAIATSVGYSIPAFYGFYYFMWKRKGTLYFVKPIFRKKVLLQSCMNGSSEMVNNLAVAVTTFLFNLFILKYAGEAGVAAITIVLYAQFLMTSVFMGFSSGVAPVISYNYGKQDNCQLQKIFKISIWAISITSVLVFLVSEMLSTPMIAVFASVDSPVFQIAEQGLSLFGISFLFTGVNIFSSALFTALSNGKISALLSFLRTFAFLVICLLSLPYFIGINGIWLAVPIAEGIVLILSIYYLITCKKVYHY